MVKTRNKFLAMLVAVAMVVTLLPAVAFADTSDDYEFVVDYDGDFVVDVQKTVSVTLRAAVDDADGYENVRIHIEADADKMELLATDTEGDEYNLAEIGVWGPSEGFSIDGDYEETTEVKATFFEAGEHTITFQLVDLESEEEVITESEATVTVYEYERPSSAASRVIDVDPDDPEAGEASEITLSLRRSNGTRIDGPVYFYVESSRDAESLSVDGDEVANHGDNDYIWKVETVADNGEVVFEIESGVPGTVTLKVGNNLTSDGDEVSGLFRDGTVEIVFGEADDYEIEWLDEVGTVSAGERYDLTLRVTEEGSDWEVSGVDVEFFERKEGRRWVSIGTDTTDRNGEAEIRVRREDAATYEYRVEVDGDRFADDIQTVEVVAGSPYRIIADKDSTYVEEGEATIKFEIQDRYGNVYDEDALDYHENGSAYRVIEFIVTDPDGDEEEISGSGDSDYIVLDDDEFLLKDFDFDEEGQWEVEAFIVGTSISAVTVVNVGEFGDVVAIEIDADETSLRERSDFFSEAYGTNIREAIREGEDVVPFATKLTTDEIDENGIERHAEAEELSYSVSDRTLATIMWDGDDAWLIAGDDVSGVVTVTVYHEDSGLEDSVEISIGGSPVSLDVEVDVDDLVADVTLILLDEDGNRTPYYGDFDGDDDYRIVVPAGVDYFDKEVFEDGEAEAEFSIEADDYGTYSIRVITDIGISRTFTVDFVEEDEDAPAARVDFFIGQTIFVVDGTVRTMDVAPFVEDGRTFIPVRFIAEALGAESDWESDEDGYTTVVTLDREDLLVTINIGEDVIQVLDKETDTVELIEMDVEAFVRDGRTWLPFRFVAEAFGAEVDWEAGPQGTERVWFIQ